MCERSRVKSDEMWENLGFGTGYRNRVTLVWWDFEFERYMRLFKNLLLANKFLIIEI